MMGGHTFWLSANVFFLCLQIHLFANYLSCEGCTTVGEVKSLSFRTYLVKSSAANETFPDAFDFNLITECDRGNLQFNVGFQMASSQETVFVLL